MSDRPTILLEHHISSWRLARFAQGRMNTMYFGTGPEGIEYFIRQLSEATELRGSNDSPHI